MNATAQPIKCGCSVQTASQSFPSWVPPWFDVSRPDPALPSLAGKHAVDSCGLSTRMMVHVSRDAGARVSLGARKSPHFSLECRWRALAPPPSVLLPAWFPFSSRSVPVPRSDASCCRCARLGYACGVPTGPAAHDRPSPSFPCTGRDCLGKTKGGETADSLLLHGRIPGSGGHHSTEGRCQEPPASGACSPCEGKQAVRLMLLPLLQAELEQIEPTNRCLPPEGQGREPAALRG